MYLGYLLYLVPDPILPGFEVYYVNKPHNMTYTTAGWPSSSMNQVNQ